MKIKLSSLRLDFQPPENLIEDTVVEFQAKFRNGETVDPVFVRFDGTYYFLQDGFHRVEAARREGLDEIDAEVEPGTLAEMESEFRQTVDALKKSLRGV